MATSGESDYWANLKLNNEFRGDSISMPTSTWLSLRTTAPTAAAPGTEVAGGSYGRIEIPMDDDNWDESTLREIANTLAITFAPASAAWGTIVGWCLMDALSGGNHLWFGPLTPSKAVGNGDTFSIPIGNLKLKSGVTTV